MKKNSNIVNERSINFVKELFKIYLEERNFKMVLSMLHENITWIGIGCNEICNNYDDAVIFLENEKNSWDGHFKILEQWYEASTISDEFCLVFGGLKIVEDETNTVLLDLNSRFSMVCSINGKDIKLYHAHFSIPNMSNAECDKTKVQCILNDLTAQKNREMILKQKSFELETVTNNIQGGIISCDFSKQFKISYANDGFFRMVGYTKEQFSKECDNCLGYLIYPDDIEITNKNLAKQIAVGNTTANINRLICRDGSIVWVLAKGTVIRKHNGICEFHGVLMDITEQKNSEKALRNSEKRYQIAMGLTDVNIFEYNVITKELITPETDARSYGIPNVVQNGAEFVIKKWNIDKFYADNYRNMFRKIEKGESFAQCYINVKGSTGKIYEFEVKLTNVFDADGKPIRAIGVIKNVTQLRQLEKEKEYGNTLASNQKLVYEANISCDKVISYDEAWATEYGLSGNFSFSDLKKAINNVIAPEHRNMVSKKLSNNTIIKAFNSGQKIILAEYRKKIHTGEYRWFRKSINIIKDNLTGDINIRSYIVDINGTKEKEIKAAEEQKYYETMVEKSISAYTLNLSKNQMVSGHEEFGKLFGIKQTDNFVEMMDELRNKAIYYEDRILFGETFSCDNMLRAYYSGKKEVVCEYRRPCNGKFIWVRTTVHIFQDPYTDDIKAFFYVGDINESKLKDLELIYKSEYDALTGVYNKITTEKYITEFLSKNENKLAKHAFLIMDVDCFKSINDNFGHSFGDDILSRASDKIKKIFRDGDILGRVGGDEFVVFMKNIKDSKIVLSKAKRICSEIAESFAKNGVVYNISASIGITIFDEHGKNYEELYKHSDAALYVSKKNGRNQYTLYNANMKDLEYDVEKIN